MNARFLVVFISLLFFLIPCFHLHFRIFVKTALLNHDKVRKKNMVIINFANKEEIIKRIRIRIEKKIGINSCQVKKIGENTCREKESQEKIWSLAKNLVTFHQLFFPR